MSVSYKMCNIIDSQLSKVNSNKIKQKKKYPVDTNTRMVSYKDQVSN